MNKMYALTSEGAWKILTMIQSYVANSQLEAAKLILRGTIIEKNSNVYSVESVEVKNTSNYMEIGIGDVRFIMKDIKDKWKSDTCTLADIANNLCRVIKCLGNATEISESVRRRIDFSGQLDQLVGCIVYDRDYGFGYIATIADNSEVYGVQYQYGGLQQLMALRVSDMSTLIFDVKVEDFFELLNTVR